MDSNKGGGTGGTTTNEYFSGEYLFHCLTLRTVVLSERRVAKRNALRPDSPRLWNQRDIDPLTGHEFVRVPYIITGVFTNWDLNKIRSAMVKLEENVCVRFYRLPNDKPGPDEPHLDIQNENGRGCKSSIGMHPKNVISVSQTHDRGRNRVERRQSSSSSDESDEEEDNELRAEREGRTCAVRRKIIHELLHSLGLMHEHTRPDAHEHLTIVRENIEDRYISQFMPKENTAYYGTPYNYASAMHYKRAAFSKNGGDTIRMHDETLMDAIGHYGSPKWTDYAKVCSMYRCSVCMGQPFTPREADAPIETQEQMFGLGPKARRGSDAAAMMDLTPAERARMSLNTHDHDEVLEKARFVNNRAKDDLQFLVHEVEKDPAIRQYLAVHFIEYLDTLDAKKAGGRAAPMKAGGGAQKKARAGVKVTAAAPPPQRHASLRRGANAATVGRGAKAARNNKSRGQNVAAPLTRPKQPLEQIKKRSRSVGAVGKTPVTIATNIRKSGPNAGAAGKTVAPTKKCSRSAGAVDKATAAKAGERKRLIAGNQLIGINTGRGALPLKRLDMIALTEQNGRITPPKQPEDDLDEEEERGRDRRPRLRDESRPRGASKPRIQEQSRPRGASKPRKQSKASDQSQLRGRDQSRLRDQSKTRDQSRPRGRDQSKPRDKSKTRDQSRLRNQSTPRGQSTTGGQSTRRGRSRGESRPQNQSKPRDQSRPKIRDQSKPRQTSRTRDVSKPITTSVKPGLAADSGSRGSDAPSEYYADNTPPPSDGLARRRRSDAAAMPPLSLPHEKTPLKTRADSRRSGETPRKRVDSRRSGETPRKRTDSTRSLEAAVRKRSESVRSKGRADSRRSAELPRILRTPLKPNAVKESPQKASADPTPPKKPANEPKKPVEKRVESRRNAEPPKKRAKSTRSGGAERPKKKESRPQLRAETDETRGSKPKEKNADGRELKQRRQSARGAGNDAGTRRKPSPKQHRPLIFGIFRL